MSRVIVLDAFPLSSTGKLDPPQGIRRTTADECHQAIQGWVAGGNRIVVPAISYYETLREFERLRASGQIRRMREFCFSVSDRYLSLTDADLELAAKLWADIRNAWLPTASNDALDGDVILAAQTLSLGLPPQDVIVATTNPAHLSRFVAADVWTNIAP
jgi:hypothetical protein